MLSAALWAEKLGRCIENWKNTLGKLVVAVNLEVIWFELWMKGALVTVEVFLFLWLLILKLAWYSVGDTF